jgi:preprotein translocase subunit Sss1
LLLVMAAGIGLFGTVGMIVWKNLNPKTTPVA